MNVHEQDRPCHSERSEESLSPVNQILRYAQNDILVPLQILLPTVLLTFTITPVRQISGISIRKRANLFDAALDLLI